MIIGISGMHHHLKRSVDVHSVRVLQAFSDRDDSKRYHK
jgi:hypothetical protein